MIPSSSRDQGFFPHLDPDRRCGIYSAAGVEQLAWSSVEDEPRAAAEHARERVDWICLEETDRDLRSQGAISAHPGPFDYVIEHGDDVFEQRGPCGDGDVEVDSCLFAGVNRHQGVACT
jgi:hypothetical protein